MAPLTNAERQARYKQRLKAASEPVWLIKHYDRQQEARSAIHYFRQFFGEVLPAPKNLELFSLTASDETKAALLVKLPFPLGADEAESLAGWGPANEGMQNLPGWQREI